MLAGMRNWQPSELPLLCFESLARLPGIKHAVTTRRGGVSRAPYDSLNLALGDDQPQAVEANLESLRGALGLERLVFAHQVHGERILRVEGGEDSPVAQADGLVTTRPGVGLLIKTADCQAVMLAAPGRAVANLHVGWRGNVANLPARGVAFLEDELGVEPGELWAAVSPSLGPCCAQFVHHARELGPDFLPYEEAPQHFNLWRVTVDQLVRAGVREERIEVSGLCTRCQDDFFSYRRDKITGRSGSVIALTQ